MVFKKVLCFSSPIFVHILSVDTLFFFMVKREGRTKSTDHTKMCKRCLKTKGKKKWGFLNWVQGLQKNNILKKNGCFISIQNRVCPYTYVIALVYVFQNDYFFAFSWRILHCCCRAYFTHFTNLTPKTVRKRRRKNTYQLTLWHISFSCGQQFVTVNKSKIVDCH